MASGGAPETRFGHVAVWTGEEMLVWGGQTAASFLQTGGRYDPSTDSWAAMTNVGAPSGRIGHTGVWTGAELIVWGGQWSADPGGAAPMPEVTELGDGGAYDPLADSWRVIDGCDAPAPRHWHTAVWTGAEVLIWGGFDASRRRYPPGGAAYDPGNDRWRALSRGGAPDPRPLHGAVWTGEEMIVWGGREAEIAGARYVP